LAASDREGDRILIPDYFFPDFIKSPLQFAIRLDHISDIIEPDDNAGSEYASEKR
jgi:hypothetical protein